MTKAFFGKNQRARSSFQRNAPWRSGGGILLCVVFAMCTIGARAQLGTSGQKLLEYGWDVPTPAQMRDELSNMEKRPFEGIIFRLSGGHNAFVTTALPAAKFDQDKQILGNLQFSRFLHNFVLIWGSPPTDFDWFNDTQWKIIERNAELLVGVARAGRTRGICFDPEPYDFSLWDYSKQPLTNAHTFAEYRAKVRQRGAGLMRAFEKHLPGATVLSFFQVSLFERYADLPEPERVARLAHEGWGLMPDFFIGMLESASAEARFIDGNENAYYYTSREQYFRAYHAIKERARRLVPTELREKYERQVRVGQALYVDQNFALREPKADRYLSYRMIPEERATWFEHNTYWALYTSDEYVWCYSERMNWWKDEVPPGLERAILDARQKIADSKPLGFEIEPLIAQVKKR